ncbi:MAG TPA: 2-isopropylmalate synthase [Bryobacteraceae bacterium]|nr:2-isopropylmalate synthase [Bryobacteraceae bacterium]
MLRDPSKKYQPFQTVPLPDRRWPSRIIDKVPVWCSVDLRDGNQALIEPMDSARKRRMFQQLLEIGFKEIEIGFPSASQTDFDFCRELIECNLIPPEVTVQVLVQSRDPLIERTFEALKGIPRAIVHLYNSTSTLQRRVVFGLDRAGVKDIAVTGARTVLQCAENYPETKWIFQYSPESFTGTELDYAVEVCESVMDIWRATPQHKVIINLPATVEMSTANIYADQIQWFGRHTSKRDCMMLSVHPHNDRGTAVAATELALMAGAERVEGTLFGNGERTGNVDIVTLAMNLYSQGLHPGLDFSRINDVIECAEFCTQLPVHPRHPYAGDLVFTAFSGSHQDAIKKGFAAQQPGEIWAIPYLPIDPKDLGRSYEPIIRVNSQSGKGGVSFLLERDYGIKLPRKLQIEFSRIIQQITDSTGREITSAEIWRTFKSEYVDQQSPLSIREHSEHSAGESGELSATVSDGSTEYTIQGEGNGPIDAFVNALNKQFDLGVRILDYDEHAVGSGADAAAVCFVELRAGETDPVMGVGMHRNILTASLQAITSALNRANVTPALLRATPAAMPARRS